MGVFFLLTKKWNHYIHVFSHDLQFLMSWVKTQSIIKILEQKPPPWQLQAWRTSWNFFYNTYIQRRENLLLPAEEMLFSAFLHGSDMSKPLFTCITTNMTLIAAGFRFHNTHPHLHFPLQERVKIWLLSLSIWVGPLVLATSLNRPLTFPRMNEYVPVCFVSFYLW